MLFGLIAIAVVAIIAIVMLRPKRHQPIRSGGIPITDLESAESISSNGDIRLSKEALLQIARRFSPRVEIWLFNSTTGPCKASIMFIAPTDEERDRLKNPWLTKEFCEAIIASGYPPKDIQRVSLAFESQETVDRDFNGDWKFRIM